MLLLFKHQFEATGYRIFKERESKEEPGLGVHFEQPGPRDKEVK
jgi:hypothetical protein